MQMAIDWSEEEEAPTPAGSKNSSRGVVSAAAAEEKGLQLTLQALQESIQKLGVNQEKLFQAMQQKESHGKDGNRASAEWRESPSGGTEE